MVNWPEGVSDGLTLPCGQCNVIPLFDWRSNGDVWERVAPPEMRLGVICLPCFAAMAEKLGVPIMDAIEQIQFTGPGYTIVYRPVTVVEHSRYR